MGLSSWSNAVIVDVTTIPKEIVYTTAGTYTWTVPANISNSGRVEFVAIQGGSAGYSNPSLTGDLGGRGGNGGNLITGFQNCTPGQKITITVGRGGYQHIAGTAYDPAQQEGQHSFVAGAWTSASRYESSNYSVYPSTGGNGAGGIREAGQYGGGVYVNACGGGGGGAAGYGAAGGHGGSNINTSARIGEKPTNAAGGGGSPSAYADSWGGGYGGGGTGLYPNAVTPTGNYSELCGIGNAGGSYGQQRSYNRGGDGGNFGGGGGGCGISPGVAGVPAGPGDGGVGNVGAVRIWWNETA